MSMFRLSAAAATLSLFAACADQTTEESAGALTLEELRPMVESPGVVSVEWDVGREWPTDIGDDEPTESEPPPPPAGVWALTIIEVAEADDSFDLDADGYGDNALAEMIVEINSLLAAESLRSERISALSAAPTGGGTYRAGLCTLDGTMEDIEGQADLFPGEDMASTGDCLHMTNVSSDSEGIFGLWDGSLALGEFVLDSLDPTELDGLLTHDRAQLYVGGVIAVDPLAGMLRELGAPALADDVYSLADIDADGDSVNEGISATFKLSGLKVQVAAR